MKKIFIVATAMIALASCGNNETKKEETVISSADSAKSTETVSKENTTVTTPPMDSAAMMKAWMEYMTPGKEHAMLAKQTGSWKEEITSWMTEGAPAEKNTSTSTVKMIMNGLYQESIHKGNFNGMPFEGRGITGYDNSKKKFVSSWIDNMGTGIMTMEGTYDSANKMITLQGTMTDPLTNSTVDMKETMTFIDDKTFMLEMYEKRNGKERKNMEIKSTKM